MTIVNLITIAEADDLNANYPEWLALTDPVKSNHIFRASLYMQTNWACVDVDWGDTATISDSLKMACALYAEADRIGLLYNNMVLDTEEARGRIIEYTERMGPMSETTKWAETGSVVSNNPLGYVNDIMSTECYRLSGRAGKVVRV